MIQGIARQFNRLEYKFLFVIILCFKYESAFEFVWFYFRVRISILSA